MVDFKKRRGEEVPQARQNILQARADVYDRLDAERAYQAKKHGHWDSTNETCDYLSYMRKHEGIALLANRGDQARALHAVRKIAALAVACMEVQGLVRRQPPTRVNSHTSIQEVGPVSIEPRTCVYGAIDDERQYQDNKYATLGDADHYRPSSTLGFHLALLRVYLNKADDRAVRCLASGQDTVRKIAAIAVRCLEELGCPERES